MRLRELVAAAVEAEEQQYKGCDEEGGAEEINALKGGFAGFFG